MLGAARRLVEGDRYAREGKWKTWEPLLLAGQDVHRATLGLIGLGRIGSAVARRAKGFEMRVMYYDPFRREDLEQNLQIDYRPFNDVLRQDRKSTRLNSSHPSISYAVFCLKKK